MTDPLEQSEPVLVENNDEPEKTVEKDEPQVSSKNCKKLCQIFALLQHREKLSQTNKFLITAGDMNLSCVGYPSLLLGAIIRYIGESPKVRAQLAIWSRHLPNDSKLKQRLSDPTRLADRLKTLYGLTSDVRTFVRLWQSLDYVEWAVASLQGEQEPDTTLRYVDYLQLFACIWYQILENIAYLGSHGVLSMTTKTENRLWSVSCICWAIHVQLDFVKIFRRRALSRDEINQRWYMELVKNIAYVPLSVHWSLEEGCLPDFIVGLFGTYTTYVSAIPAWKSLF